METELPRGAMVVVAVLGGLAVDGAGRDGASITLNTDRIGALVWGRQARLYGAVRGRLRPIVSGRCTITPQRPMNT
ncbi:hypothetical protein E2C01_031908 [Portunus trituberculatus]|uniref:Uncharacterized protein n=1 Tax=Portunus trituberculatus TaxID=210409 RepID=A0A5B7EZX1_PORTR|nr:hypothetical protein [Portunus trituberculatus]